MATTKKEEIMGPPPGWKTGLFECFGDCSSCCLGCWCPCILYAKNVQAIKGEEFCGSCCGFFWLLQSLSALNALGFYFFGVGGPATLLMPLLTVDKRKMLREAYDLPDSCGGESYLVHGFCLACALCQEARELKLRGHSPTNPLYERGTMNNNTPVTVITEAPVQVESIGTPFLAKKQQALEHDNNEDDNDDDERAALLNPIKYSYP